MTNNHDPFFSVERMISYTQYFLKICGTHVFVKWNFKYSYQSRVGVQVDNVQSDVGTGGGVSA